MNDKGNARRLTSWYGYQSLYAHTERTDIGSVNWKCYKFCRFITDLFASITGATEIANRTCVLASFCLTVWKRKCSQWYLRNAFLLHLLVLLLVVENRLYVRALPYWIWFDKPRANQVLKANAIVYDHCRMVPLRYVRRCRCCEEARWYEFGAQKRMRWFPF